MKGDDAMMVRIFPVPSSESELVILKAAWAADNGHETAVFATEEQAREFAIKRWASEGISVRPKG